MLTEIRQATDAANITVTNAEPNPPGVLYRLPLFLADTNLPIRWSVPLAGIVRTGEKFIAEWSTPQDRIHGKRAGVLTIGDPSSQFPGYTTKLWTSRRMLSREIERIINAGHLAKWSMTEHFRPFVLGSLDFISKNVGLEVTNGQDHVGVIDSIEAETIADGYLLGRDGNRGDALFSTLLARAASDLRDGVGDRVTYLTKGVVSSLDREVRRHIGDPVIGRLVRKAHRSLGQASSPDAIRARLRTTHPSMYTPTDTIIAAALSAGKSANLSTAFEEVEELEELTA